MFQCLRQSSKQITPHTESILTSLKILFSLEEISKEQTGTAGSDLMKGYSLWLPISSFHGSPSPLTLPTSIVTQMPSWQVLHSLQKGKTKHSRVRGILWPYRRHRHHISLSSSLNRTAKGKIIILKQNTDFLTPQSNILFMALSTFHTHTHRHTCPPLIFCWGDTITWKSQFLKDCLPIPEGY